MALLKVVHYPERILLTAGAPVTEFDDKLKKLIDDMFETMYHEKGVGLAAPQVAVSKRIFIMDCSGAQDEDRKHAIINPEIISVEGEQISDEGCLSFPGLYQPVKRGITAIVRFQDLKGAVKELSFSDLEARCVLHETDHCDGIVFLERMTPLKRQLVKQKIKRMKKAGEWD